MKTRLLLVIGITAAVLAIPTAAFAKGPTIATISGPGIKGGGVTLRGMGEPGSGAKLGDLAEQSGLFSAMFGAASDGHILPVKPTVAALGAHYVVVYTIPHEDPQPANVTMDLYPYAPGGPVTYTRPGPPVFSGQEPLAGQWFQGPTDLRDLLVSVGLPDRAALPGFIVAPVVPYVPPVAAAPQPVAQTEPVRTTSPGPGPWIALVVVAMTVIVAATQQLRRRRTGVAVAG